MIELLKIHNLFTFLKKNLFNTSKTGVAVLRFTTIYYDLFFTTVLPQLLLKGGNRSNIIYFDCYLKVGVVVLRWTIMLWI